MVDTESGLVLEAETGQGALEDARKVTDDLATSLVSGLGVEVAREAAAPRA